MCGARSYSIQFNQLSLERDLVISELVESFIKLIDTEHKAFGARLENVFKFCQVVLLSKFLALDLVGR